MEKEQNEEVRDILCARVRKRASMANMRKL